jgi:RNA polymerase sigma-70 factor (ECF subfamily)
MLKFRRTQPSEPLTDEQLLSAYLSSGSARYLGDLYERYLPMVYGVCLKILKDAGKAEDAAMAIYETLDKKVREHQISAFRGWLYVLARNHCIMEWRKDKRLPTDLYAPENMQHFDAVEDAFEMELPLTGGLSLQKCLEQLNAIQRNCVQLFYYEDKSYKEIAEMLKEEVGKVRSYIQNGKRNLKTCMETNSQ